MRQRNKASVTYELKYKKKCLLLGQNEILTQYLAVIWLLVILWPEKHCQIVATVVAYMPSYVTLSLLIIFSAGYHYWRAAQYDVRLYWDWGGQGSQGEHALFEIKDKTPRPYTFRNRGELPPTLLTLLETKTVASCHVYIYEYTVRKRGKHASFSSKECSPRTYTVRKRGEAMHVHF